MPNLSRRQALAGLFIAGSALALRGDMLSPVAAARLREKQMPQGPYGIELWEWRLINRKEEFNAKHYFEVFSAFGEIMQVHGIATTAPLHSKSIIGEVPKDYIRVFLMAGKPERVNPNAFPVTPLNRGHDGEDFVRRLLRAMLTGAEINLMNQPYNTIGPEPVIRNSNTTAHTMMRVMGFPLPRAHLHGYAPGIEGCYFDDDWRGFARHVERKLDAIYKGPEDVVPALVKAHYHMNSWRMAPLTERRLAAVDFSATGMDTLAGIKAALKKHDVPLGADNEMAHTMNHLITLALSVRKNLLPAPAVPTPAELFRRTDALRP